MEAYTRSHLRHCICLGAGYYRVNAKPGEPWFGVAMPCLCKLSDTEMGRSKQLLNGSGMTTEELSRMTFESFLPRKAKLLEGHTEEEMLAVHRLCREYAREPRRRNLILQGEMGSGKTHLAYAVAGYCLQHGTAVYAKNEPDLLSALREGFKHDTFEEWLRELKQMPLLVIDDFGAAAETDWTKQTLFQIVDFRYRQHLPMVITTNWDVASEMGSNRVLSRLCEGCEVEGGRALVVQMPCGNFRMGKKG